MPADGSACLKRTAVQRLIVVVVIVGLLLTKCRLGNGLINPKRTRPLDRSATRVVLLLTTELLWNL